jgi:hypothetical protein
VSLPQETHAIGENLSKVVANWRNGGVHRWWPKSVAPHTGVLPGFSATSGLELMDLLFNNASSLKGWKQFTVCYFKVPTRQRAYFICNVPRVYKRIRRIRFESDLN